MRCRRWVVVGLGLFVLGSGDATPARASSLLTYVFQGTLASIGDPTHEFGAGTQVGTPFTLQFSVATDAPNMYGEGAPYGGLYKIAPQDLSLTLNGQPFAPASLQPSASGGSVGVVRDTGSFGGTASFEGAGPGPQLARCDFLPPRELRAISE
ncbi:hypothetical protein [Singulisphaera sp. PoT]|uniref:hypothetical protein n=1 Tax=Singulisphaera sp. PoT TaxID=3411797 RepID=UPI003BF538FA